MAKRIVDLDVREMLKAKQEPFQLIMQTVQSLEEEDVMQLHATFEPVPLFKVLGKQGLKNITRKHASDDYTVQFYRDAAELPYWHIENRDLEPPQPMLRTLELLDSEPRFQNGEWGLEIWNRRVPALLLPELEERGFQYDIDERGENGAVVKIHH